MLSGKSSAVAVMTVVLMCGASSASAQTYTIIGDSSRVTINDKLVVSARDSSVTYERRDISAWVADLSGPSRHDSVLALWAAFPPLELIANPLAFGGPGPFRTTEGIAGLLNQGRHAEVKLLANRTVSAHIEVVLSELTKLVVNEAGRATNLWVDFEGFFFLGAQSDCII